jgi:hypothetical protein
MSDHEFEKQVRQKLDDLRLKPSVESWEKIEDRIRKVGRRPAAVYWMPLLLLMLGAGGYFYFYSFSTVEKRESDFTVLQKNSESSVKNFKNNNQSPNNKINSSKSNNKHRYEKNITGTTSSAKKNDISFPEKENIAVSSGIIKNDISPVENSTNFSLSDNLNTTPLSPNTTFNTENLSYFSKLQQPSGASLKKPLSKELFNMDNQLNLSPAINLKHKNISKKWAIGVRASAGISAVNEGKFIDISRATVEDVAYRASFAYRPPQYTPSRLTPGFSFSAGVTFQRQLSRKISLSTGLSYLQLNTKNKVGVKVYGNQVVNNGTRGYLNVYNYYMLDENAPTDYMNRYHYLELPVSVSIGLNNSRKLPIFFDAGIAYSRLLGSNSLHFDGTTGVYYKNDRLLNDNQFAFTTGFAFKVFNRTKYPVLIGPSARYNVTRMLQKDVPGNKTFMTLGADMKLFIW